MNFGDFMQINNHIDIALYSIRNQITAVKDDNFTLNPEILNLLNTAYDALDTVIEIRGESV
jgi:hypothetical protein